MEGSAVAPSPSPGGGLDLQHAACSRLPEPLNYRQSDETDKDSGEAGRERRLPTEEGSSKEPAAAEESGRALAGALSTIVEFAVTKLPPESSRNLVLQMSTALTALQHPDCPRSDTYLTTYKYCKRSATLPSPSLPEDDGTLGDKLGEDGSSEDSDVSSEECFDLTLSDDSQDEDYSMSDDEEDLPSISLRGPNLGKSSKSNRLEAKNKGGVNDRFPPSETSDFVRFLGSPIGGMKTNVKEVDSAVSRCLYFIDGNVLQWSNMLKLREVSHWLEMHSSFGDGPSALINKIHYVQAGLKYLSNYKSDNECEQAKCFSAIKELDSWKARYRPLLKRRQSQIKDAMCSKDDEIISLQNYTATVNDPNLQSKAWAIINKSSSGGAIARDEFLFVMRYCLTIIGVKNAKRPGVLAGMTLDEWEHRTSCPTGLKLVLVNKHKTAFRGSSHVYIEGKDESMIAGYVSLVRSHAQNARRSRFVFITFKGTQLQNVSSEISKVFPAGTKFSATVMRKAYSTSVGELGDYLKEKQVAELADHSHETQQNYYAALACLKRLVCTWQVICVSRHEILYVVGQFKRTVQFNGSSLKPAHLRFNVTIKKDTL